VRKDVKLGFAIGGVLLAVAIVFALVNSSRPKTTNDGLADDTTAQTDGSPVADGGKSDPKSTVVEAGKLAKADPAKAEAKADPTKAEPAKAEPAKTEVAKNDTPAESHDVFGKTNWDESLKTGTPVPLMASVGGSTPKETVIEPSNPQSGVSTPRTPASVATGAAGFNYVQHPQQGDADEAVKTAVGTPAVTPAKVVAIANTDVRTASTHTIKNGETFVTVAAAHYGNGKYYKLIVAANPKVDPSHLKIGTVITLPALDAKADTTKAAANTSAAVEKAVDNKTQYRVQSGDNLHRICVRLYGDASKVDDLYALNKAAIGSDPAKLKLGMILTLPATPTATASR